MFDKVMNNKAKLLISECLCGVSCRYDGKDNLIEQLPLLKDTFDLVSVCPEVLGGLTILETLRNDKVNVYVRLMELM